MYYFNLLVKINVVVVVVVVFVVVKQDNILFWFLTTQKYRLTAINPMAPMETIPNVNAPKS